MMDTERTSCTGSLVVPDALLALASKSHCAIGRTMYNRQDRFFEIPATV